LVVLASTSLLVLQPAVASQAKTIMTANQICRAVAKSVIKKLLADQVPTNAGTPETTFKVPTCDWADAGGDGVSVSVDAWTGAPFNCKGWARSLALSGGTVCLSSGSHGQFMIAADKGGVYVEASAEFNPSTGTAKPPTDEEMDLADVITRLIWGG
jgi:hypothetical protein